MNHIELYTLSLKSLKSGKYEYNYECNDSFFEMLDETEITHGDVKAHVEVIKSGLSIEIRFNLKGTVESVCDRCLGAITLPIDLTDHVFVKFGKEYFEESEEMIVIPEDEGTFNIAWLVYELISLSLPLIKKHPEGKCDKEMIRIYGLHQVREIDDDEDGITEVENNEVDPRWAALKNILDNN